MGDMTGLHGVEPDVGGRSPGFVNGLSRDWEHPADSTEAFLLWVVSVQPAELRWASLIHSGRLRCLNSYQYVGRQYANARWKIGMKCS